MNVHVCVCVCVYVCVCVFKNSMTQRLAAYALQHPADYIRLLTAFAETTKVSNEQLIKDFAENKNNISTNLMKILKPPTKAKKTGAASKKGLLKKRKKPAASGELKKKRAKVDPSEKKPPQAFITSDASDVEGEPAAEGDGVVSSDLSESDEEAV